MIAEPLAMEALEDGAFVAVNPRKANRLYPPGTRIIFVPWQDRSTASHNHEFAYLTEAWRSLPETLADQIPTPEHLRKRALIETGHYDEVLINAGSQAAALRVAAAIRGFDDLAIVVTRGPLVCRRTAKSQSRRAMDKATFERSKQDILGWIAGVLRVEPGTLAKQREAA